MYINAWWVKPQQKQLQNGYIPALDGLRALAVIGVLLVHVDFKYATGGYFGVDIFFVLSGYLITRNILKELNEGNWSFIRFYTRRAARLLPALFTVVIACLFIAWWILTPEDLEALGSSAIATTLFSSNIYFWQHSGYFEPSAVSRPLLHTWSLSVEEQFYFVWPFVLVLIWSLSYARQIGLIVMLFLLSLISAYYWSSTNSEAVFYLSPFRVYQFAAGALVVLIGVNPSSTLGSILSALGLLSLLIIFTIAEDSWQQYGVVSILPTIGTVFVLLGIHSVFSRLALTMKPMLWTGKRSYSIYLVHWPIIVFWKMKTDWNLSNVEKFSVIILSIIIGWILYEHIEKAFRYRTPSLSRLPKKHIIGITIFALCNLTFGKIYVVNGGFKSRIPHEITQVTDGLHLKWRARREALKYKVCEAPASIEEYDWQVCSNPPANGKSYLVLGDSYASGTLLILSAAYPENYFGHMTIPGCHLQLPEKYKNTAGKSLCKKLYTLAFKKLVHNKNYDGIVLSSWWHNALYQSMQDTIDQLKPLNKEIILIGQRPSFYYDVSKILQTEGTLDAGALKAQHLLNIDTTTINRRIQTLFAEQVEFIDLYKLQCPDQCSILDSNNRLIYLDRHHLTIDGANEIGTRLKAVRPNL